MHEESETLRSRMRSLFDGVDVANADSRAEPSAPSLASPAATLRDEVLEGELAFVDAAERDARAEELATDGALVVRWEPSAAARGRVEAAVDAAIEDALAEEGEVAPGIGGSEGTPADERLSDQLFRVRRAGRSGLALVLGTLEPAATPMGALESVDSAIVRFYAKATRERPVVLLLDSRDRDLGAYADPIPLELAVAAPRPAAAPAAREETAPAPAEAAPAVDEAREEEEVVAATLAIAEACPAPFAAPPLEIAPPPEAIRVAEGEIDDEAPTPEEPAVAVEAPPPAKPVDVRPFVHALSALKGPQSLATLESAFASAYVPLLEALGRGEHDPRAERAMAEFKTSFSKAYEMVYPTLYARPKRPKMVLDAPAIAQKLARLHNARTSMILVVDGMRFDLGRAVRADLETMLSGFGSLTQEEILWALLPTTTERQLDAIGRGPDALRSEGESGTGVDSIRGRAAEVVRRVRVGHREIMKLDTLRARLPALGGTDTESVYDAMPNLAETTAAAITKFAKTLQSRTLLYVMGDHGFTIDHEGQVATGGASPEEVLVPGFAFLVGALH